MIPEVDVHVEIAMIASLYHALLHHPLEIAQINYVAGLGIWLALHCDLEDVVVPVPVGVVALTERPLIPFIRLIRIVEPVRSVEMNLARDVNERHVWYDVNSTAYLNACRLPRFIGRFERPLGQLY
jgi:hypothetical protein